MSSSPPNYFFKSKKEIKAYLCSGNKKRTILFTGEPENPTQGRMNNYAVAQDDSCMTELSQAWPPSCLTAAEEPEESIL